MELVYTWFITWMPLFLVYKPGNRLCFEHRAKTALPAIFILVPAIADHAVKAFLDARGPI